MAELAHDVGCLADRIVLVAGQADQLAELAEDEYDSHPSEVADEHGLREVVGDPTQTDQASSEVHDPDENREGRREHRVLDAPGRRERGQSGRHEQ